MAGFIDVASLAAAAAAAQRPLDVAPRLSAGTSAPERALPLTAAASSSGLRRTQSHGAVGERITLASAGAVSLVAALSATVARRWRRRRQKKWSAGVAAVQRQHPRVCCLAEAEAAAPCPASVVDGDMPGRYEFSEVEEDLYRWWEGSGFFKPEVADKIPPGEGGHKPYVMPMPPPNVTGRLHMGHALFASIEDCLVRFHRMYGHRTLWLPGTDHAGIATQMLVERQLAADGVSRLELGREKFVEKVWEWKAEKGGAIVDQLRRIGASADWSREQFTLNDHMSEAVIEAFCRMHEKGLISRGKRMVNWSPVLQTAVSDLEVEYSEVNGFLYHFKYVLADSDEYIPVATTRPETILGDAAVCVHPEDPRYSHLIGKEVVVPMQNRKIPVIADEYVDREFGTGALKITPAHDFNDFEIAQTHKLPFYVVIGLDGSISPSVADLGSPCYAGLDRFKCRDQIWKDMEAAGLVLKTQDHVQRVPLSQRSGEVIEPMLSAQWFLTTAEMMQRSMDAVDDGTLRIQPERYKKIWANWLKEKQPWCISRQLWWGHRLPVWYKKGTREMDNVEYYVARSEAEAREKHGLGPEVELEQESDVLDTWFSSGLWPFATVGWPDEGKVDFERFYPASVLATGYDILFFWVARMVMMGLTLTDKVPFAEIYLHGLVRDENNQKMSKTKGNVVDPLDSIGEYGTDALRFALLSNTVAGTDLPLSKGILENGKSFANKIWNVGRFIIKELEQGEECLGSSLTPDDIASMPWVERALLSKLHSLVDTVKEALLTNRFDAPAKALSEFLRDDLAAWYVEASKTRLQPHLGGDPASARGKQARQVLLYSLEMTLRLLHPFMPFVTEAVWQRLPRNKGDAAAAASVPESLMLNAWPVVKDIPRDQDAESWFAKLCTLVSAVRNARAQQDIPPKERVALNIRCGDAALKAALQSEGGVIAWVSRADPERVTVEDLTPADVPAGFIRIVVDEQVEVDMSMPQKTAVDFEKELARLRKQLTWVTGQLEGTEKKITPQFLERANPTAREKIMQKRDDLRQQKVTVAAQLKELEDQSQQAGQPEAEVAEVGRRGALGVLAGCSFLGSASEEAVAKVGEGDELPTGAKQEDRVRIALEKWKELGEKTQKGEVKEEADWQNSQGFLRRMYSLAPDMEYLLGGLSAEKKTTGEEIITKFKKEVKLMDKPAKAQDVEKFMSMHKEISAFLVDFLGLLDDMPAVLEGLSTEDDVVVLS
eukprot:TRINITY_DN16_c0_g2_i1.p1 TRINITY_DN16_c0_g2~~TRINITY_DN16_c0_g2_i1.p1  ORF type:complete len:1228 (-),score=376.27 TRINITY_DN16_c0_g2_i1:100-3783(-)